MQPLLARRPDGTLSLLFLPPELCAVLLELPELLDVRHRPELRSLLAPDAAEDDDALNAEWARMAHPELLHLFASARDLVAADLELLRTTQGHPAGGRLDIAPAHRDAWITGIQTAVQVLRAEHAIESTDLDEERARELTPAQLEALYRVHTLYMLQSLLLEDAAEELTE